MRITTSRASLTQILAVAALSCPRRATLPVLTYAKFTARDGRVTITTTDLDNMTTLVLPDAKATADGDVLVPLKDLREILKGKAEKGATVALALIPADTEGGNPKVEVERDGIRSRLLSLPVDEFPTFQWETTDKAWSGPASRLLGLVLPAMECVSEEESRPILNGLYVHYSEREQEIRAVGTNGHIMALRCSKRVKGDEKLPDLIIPPTVFKLLVKALGKDTSGKLTLTVTPERKQTKGDTHRTHLKIVFEGGEIIARLIEGPYPNYAQVIPRDNDRTLIVEREAFIKRVKPIVAVASDQTHRIKFTLKPGLLVAEASTPDKGDAKMEMDVLYSGEPMTIGFNGQYVLDTLAVLTTAAVSMSFKAPERAALVEPVGIAGSVNLIMPLRLID
jgi:DNA polymerase-3 subunit beta